MVHNEKSITHDSKLHCKKLTAGDAVHARKIARDAKGYKYGGLKSRKTAEVSVGCAIEQNTCKRVSLISEIQYAALQNWNYTM